MEFGTWGGLQPAAGFSPLHCNALMVAFRVP
jgi:hypothetical protein